MKLQLQAKYALAAVIFGGVLTACESEYDPTVTETNQPVTETQQEITGTDETMENSDIAGNQGTVTGDSGTVTEENEAVTEYDADEGLADSSSASPDSQESQTADVTSEEYEITDERDGTPDTGSWEDSMESQNEQVSRDTANDTAKDTESDENQEDALSGTYEDVQSDVAAKEQQAVQFDFDSAELTSEARSKLDDFIASMEEVDPQEVELSIKGYTDSQGSQEYNEALASRRAEAVKQYLQEQGLPSENLKTEAVGEASSESVAATTQDNRRVVVEMVVPYAEELTAN